MIIVVGASGRLGRAVTAELLARGRKVRAGCRRPAKATALAASGAEIVKLDLEDPHSIAAALAGGEAVFTAIHGLTGRRRNNVARVDVDGQRRLIDAANKAGARRYVLTSVQNASVDSPIGFTRAKSIAEQHLIHSGLDYTILRPSAFADLYAHDLIGAAVLAGKPVRLLGSGDTRRNLVAVADVALVAVRALLEEGFSRRVVAIGGPDNITDREVAALYGRLSGKPVRIRALSVRTLRLIAAIIGPLHPGVRNLLTFITQMEGRGDLNFDASEMPSILGREPTSLEAFVTSRISA